MRDRKRHKDPLGLISGLCLLLSLLLAFQIGWQYYGSGLDTQTMIRTGNETVRTPIPVQSKDHVAKLRHDTPPVEQAPAHGVLFGWIFLPDVDRAWSRPIMQGTDPNVLDGLGAGHYEPTVMPGGRGNSAYAGHDTVSDFGLTYRLKPGNRIIIRTASHWYVYEVTDSRIVTSADTWVIGDEAPGVERGITLTTCWPLFTPTDTGQRYVTWGRFVGWADTSDGVPEALADSSLSFREKVSRRSVERLSELRLPVTGVAGIACLTGWLVADGLMWLCFHRRMRAVWSRPSWNPMVWLWRLQAGPTGGGWGLRIVSLLIRMLLAAMLLAGVMFLMWRWACPRLADVIPWLAAPHSTVA
ncbi:sortase [Bifidobacterium sp. SO1]|uniref:sortase domain-containing protein n=1 Tax=Bifidobacterium sp. SO1 TaxID=2809029 RepID=UPI001BDC993D|nr:sortase [Bifidobacterium sp. SO1]MBT1162926.1 class E sortase [Bifidobacterium sp. SO1]